MRDEKKNGTEGHTRMPSPLNTLTWAAFELDYKTVGFFLKISKEIGKVCRKSLPRAKRASLTRP